METIFEQNHRHITELREHHGDDVLRVLVWCPKNGDPCYYIKDDSALSFFKCNENEKIQIEVSRWSKALCNALTNTGDVRPLDNLSPALHSIYKTHPHKLVKGLFGRTLRMLMFLEAVLLGTNCSPDNPYYGVGIEFEFTSVHLQLKELVMGMKRFSNLQDESLNTTEGKWDVSLPLLLIVAVGESQCEHIQPFAWEAYSAARARDELTRRWTGINETVVNTIAMLIRCQLAIGRKERKSGIRNYLHFVVRKHDGLAFDRDCLFKSLQVLAVVGEARNHKVPKVNISSHIDFNVECNIDWDDNVQFKKIQKYLAFEPPSDFDSSNGTGPPAKHDPENYTWSYFRPEYLGLEGTASDIEDVDALKRTILLTKDCSPYDIISFGRIQTQKPLKALMGKIIRGWSAREDAQGSFGRFFRLQPLAVPHPFLMINKEDTLQVLLKDELAAECLLFPSDDRIDKLIQKAESPETTIANVGNLFAYLLDVSITELSLEQDAIWEENVGDGQFPALAEKLYVPFPLVRRITDIIYRLQPSTCFNIPINIDRKTTERVHFPYGILKKDHLHKRILASFLLSTVLNRAMAAGLNRAEIDLENLAIPSLTSQPEETADNEMTDLMQPKDWRETVQHLYTEGGYNVLLDRFLRDFNTQRKNVHFETRLSHDTQFGSAKLDALAVGEIRNDLKQYLAPEGDVAIGKGDATSTPDFWLLGVDIGGTLTKCQLFGFFCTSQALLPIGSVFRMSTPSVPRKPLSEQNKIRESIDEYVTRLVELIRKRTDSKLEQIDHSRLVIGLAWPGPVREGHPNGTSGLMKEFGLSHDISQNRIDDIWEVDVAGAVARLWQKEFNKKQSPFISLLNDGDADAVGAVVFAQDNAPENHDYDRVLSVVKLGTGLAGALLKTFNGRGLSLVPGLYEWGKIVLDLAAPPKQGFPQGVATEYLSKKCLPRLAEARGEEGGYFQHKDVPDSAEIGLILETAKSSDPAKAYNELLVECGSIQGNRRPMYGEPVSAEVLRVVYRNPSENPDLLHEVRLALRQFANVEEDLKTHLENYGRIRLDRLISPNQTLFKKEIEYDEVENLNQHERFKEACSIAESCARSLGHFLGDFCVLLNDELGVNEVRLTGGVLTGETGKYAIAAARERVGFYGLCMQEISAGAFTIGVQDYQVDPKKLNTINTPIDQPNQENCNFERGAFGAACFAATSFIQDKKQKGLQKLRSMLLEVHPGDLVNVNGTRISVSGKDAGIDFREHALSKDDLQNFLETRGPDWGYYKTAGSASFVRWK